MATGAELIRKIKDQISEVDPRDVHDVTSNGNGNGTVIVDVREQHEFEEAHIPGAVHVPRAHLEQRIEGAAPDRSSHVVLYCASGNRSALAAHTMQDLLGYENVESMRGGITLWKDRGYEVEVPARAHPRAARALLASPADPGDRPRGPDEAARREGAAPRRRRPRLARCPLPGRGRGGHARHRGQRRGGPVQPAAAGGPLERPRGRAQGRLGRDLDPRDQPRGEGREVPGPHRRLQHHGDHRGLRRDRRRPRQLPHPLPPERRLGAASDPGGLGVHPRLRGPALGVPPLRGAVLPLPLSRRRRPPSWPPAAAPRACSAFCPA